MTDAPERILAWPGGKYQRVSLAGGRPDDMVEYIRADLAPTDAQVRALVEALSRLNAIVEGIDGAMNHGTWRDERGRRLKDTDAWIEVYNARAALRDLEAP